VVLGVQFRRFVGMMGGVHRVSVRRVGVMCGALLVAGLMMPGGFPMVSCRMLVVVSCLGMVFRCLL